MHAHRLHHRAVAAARRNTPDPSPGLRGILVRGRPHHPTANGGLSLPTDPIPPFGQAPSSLIAPFIPSVLPPVLPTISLPGILPTIPNTDTPTPPKPTPSLSSNDITSAAETHTLSSVLSTASSLVSPKTPLTTTSNPSLPSQVPAVVTQVVPPSSSTSGLGNNGNNGNNSSTGQTSGTTTSSGSVTAGVVVGLVGACAMVVFLVFLVRRNQTKARNSFDAGDFRRSAVLIHDPPANEDAARGYKPRPPSMIERKLADSRSIPAVTYGNTYSAPPGDYYNNTSGTHNQAMFAEGKVENPNGGPFTSVQLTNPFSSAPPSPGSFATAGHSQSPNGVLVGPNPPYIRDPPPGPRRTSRPATGNDPGAANGFTFPPRQGSRPSTAERQQQQSVVPEQIPPDDYVDLSRSSVSPFQAAQYEAISKRLNVDVPHSFDDIDVASVMSPSPLEYIDEAPPVPPKSPLERPQNPTAVVEFSVESADDAPPPVPSKSPFGDPTPEHEAEILQDPVRESYTSRRTGTPELLDFPVPPAPALSLMSRHRADSWTPTLPELRLDSGRQGILPPNGINGKPALNRYPSSPLAANSTTERVEFEGTPISPPKNMPHTQSTTETQSRPNTVYDPEDAYGGI